MPSCNIFGCILVGCARILYGGDLLGRARHESSKLRVSCMYVDPRGISIASLTKIDLLTLVNVNDSCDLLFWA